MSNFTCQSKSFISIFFICQVSACELRPFSCYNLANDIYSQTAKTVFSHLKKWRETLDFVSCFHLHLFHTLAASCVLYNRTEHASVKASLFVNKPNLRAKWRRGPNRGQMAKGQTGAKWRRAKQRLNGEGPNRGQKS